MRFPFLLRSDDVARVMREAKEALVTQQEQLAAAETKRAELMVRVLHEKRTYLAFLKAIRIWNETETDYEEALTTVISALGDEVASLEEWLVVSETRG